MLAVRWKADNGIALFSFDESEDAELFASGNNQRELMAGRKPKPTAIKKLNGNPGKRPLNKNEPMPETAEPDMPVGLNAVAQEEWRRIVPILLKNKVLTVADGAALAGYCRTFAMIRQAQAEIDALGITLKEPIYGTEIDPVTQKPKVIAVKIKKNPAVTVAHECERLLRAYESDFGMSPSSRSRVTVSPDAPKDPMEEFLRKGRAAKAKPVQKPVVPVLESIDADESAAEQKKERVN